MARAPYPTDLTDAQWALIADLLPAPAATGRPRGHPSREVVNAILYQSRTGCQWRHLPHDLPPRSTVYAWFARWRDDGTWDRVLAVLRTRVRHDEGRHDQPSAAVLDSQRVPNAGPANEVGYDAGKKVRGRKRHVIVDSLGLLMAVLVTSAYVLDLAGGHQLLRRARLTNAMLGIVRCDSAYHGLARRAARLRLLIEVVGQPVSARVHPRPAPLDRGALLRLAVSPSPPRQARPRAHRRVGRGMDQGRRHRLDARSPRTSRRLPPSPHLGSPDPLRSLSGHPLRQRPLVRALATTVTI